MLVAVLHGLFSSWKKEPARSRTYRRPLEQEAYRTELRVRKANGCLPEFERTPAGSASCCPGGLPCRSGGPSRSALNCRFLSWRRRAQRGQCGAPGIPPNRSGSDQWTHCPVCTGPPRWWRTRPNLELAQLTSFGCRPDLPLPPIRCWNSLPAPKAVYAHQDDEARPARPASVSALVRRCEERWRGTPPTSPAASAFRPVSSPG